MAKSDHKRRADTRQIEDKLAQMRDQNREL